MFKEKIFHSQQLKFMLSNLLAFTIIFTIFGVIIFTQVQGTLFQDADRELERFKEMLTDNVEGGFNPLDKDADEQKATEDDGDGTPPADKMGGRFNPRIIALTWNEDGEIINQDQIGSWLFANLQGIKLDTSTVDTITNVTINDYRYRYLLVEDTVEGDDVAYTQLIINIEAEQNIIDNFLKLIIVCSLVFITLSITASYILSKKMMAPIIQSWKKQAEFVENASHELRTPLTIIQNKLELLLTAPNERISSKFENIALSLSETRRLSKLTSDLLTLARADSAETQLQKQSLHADTFIKGVATPYMEIAELQDKHMWLSLKSDFTFEGDEVRLHQLLVILLDNALKYTGDEDSIGVKSYEEDHKLVIEVTDTGIGIAEENLPYIFDRFYREDKARSRETGGMGLGLSIAHWIVTEHGGTIKALRNEKRGTTFRVKLPMK